MKQFLIKLSYTVFPLWLITVGLVLYLSIYIVPNATGDIGRLGLIPFGDEYGRELNKGALHDTLFHTITRTDEVGRQSVDVLTIGDSFSQQGNYGYQNYLSLRGLTVMNCRNTLYSNPIQYAYNLLTTNLIDSTNVKVLIVERVERRIEEIFLQFSFGHTNKTMTRQGVSRKSNKESGKKSTDKWSLARVRDYVYYKTTPSRSPIYKATLDQDFFTSPAPNSLYFYYLDIESGVRMSKEGREKLVEVFESLCKLAEEKGIFILLVVPVDKYDLYQKHIVNNIWPSKTINEEIDSIIGDSPNLLLTKKILMPLIDNGENDVFLFNDTHWSYKASEAVANAIYNNIKSFEKLENN